MFQMTDEAKTAGTPKELLIKIALFVAGMAVLGGVVYFFAFSGAPK